MNNLTVSKSGSWHYKFINKHYSDECSNWELKKEDTNICEYGKLFIKACFFACMGIFWIIVRYPLLISLVIILVIIPLFIVWCQYALFYFPGAFGEREASVFIIGVEKFSKLMHISISPGFVHKCIGSGAAFLLIEVIVIIVVAQKYAWKYIGNPIKDSIIGGTKKISHSSTPKLIKEWVLAKKGKYCMRIKIID